MVVVHRTTATAWPGDGLWYDKDVSEEDAKESDEARHHALQAVERLAADLVNEPVHATVAAKAHRLERRRAPR